MIKRRARSWLWLVTAAALSLVPAFVAVADSTVIAVSRARHAKVLADGSPSWCGPNLHLTLQLDPDSPVRGDPAAQATLLSRLRRPIEVQCPAAREASASVAGEPTARFAARADGGWSFAPARTGGAQLDLDSSAAPQPVAPAPTPPATPATQFILPRDFNYPSLAVAFAQQNPGSYSDPQMLRYWASYRYQRRFQRVSNQEFELQPLLEQARQDMQTTAAATPRRRVYMLLPMQFGAYNFPAGRFPITPAGGRLTVGMDPCCQQGETLPRSFQIDVEGLDAIDGFPMAQADAQRFAEGRSHYGYVDRNITALLTIDVDDKGIGAPQYGTSSSTGTLYTVDLLSGRNHEDVVYRFSPVQLAEARKTRARAKADAERQAKERQAAEQRETEQRIAEQRTQQARMEAEQQKQQLMSQRQNLIAELTQLPPSARLRAFMTPSPYVTGQRLDNLREARADALITRQAWEVVMLVQAEGDGHSNVSTTWPSHLSVSTPAAGPALVAAHWYLVAGRMAVPGGEDLPAAELQASEVFACAREACGDAAEPDAIVARKLATLTDNSHPP